MILEVASYERVNDDTLEVESCSSINIDEETGIDVSYGQR